MTEQVPSKELDYPPKYSEYEAEWSKRGYEPHIATLLAKADWSEDMINWQEDEIERLHNEIEAGGSRERGTSPNRSCGTAGQSGPASSLLQSSPDPGPNLNDAIRCIDYADCMLAQSGYTEDSTTRMRLANARAIISRASQPNDGWSALCEAVAKADPVNYRRPTHEPRELRDALDAIASPSRPEDYGWWTQVARRALGVATANETATPPPPPEQEPKSFAPWRVPDPPRTDVAEALRPFVDLFEKSNERYRQRGGDPDQFKDTHPFREITAKELPLGVWRRAQAALRAASPPGARYPMINVPAITDAYESGFGHGKNLDDLPNPYSDGTHERQAYAIGYEEGERRRRVNGSSGYCNQGAHEHHQPPTAVHVQVSQSNEGR